MAPTQPARLAEATCRISHDLPVIAILLTASALPFRYLPQLVKFGAISVLSAAAVELAETMMVANGVIRWGSVLPLLAAVIAYVPFDVAWTRVVLNGPSGVQSRSYFQLGHTEARYLLVSVLFVLVWVMMLVPGWLINLGAKDFDHHLQLEAGVLLLLQFVAIVICVVRSVFIFPAVATDSYHGLALEWSRSKGRFERLLMLMVLVRLPYLLVIDMLDRLIHPYSPFVLTALLTLSQSVVYLLAEAISVAAITLAYRHTAELPSAAVVG
jgi:hypothetical protein